MATRNLTPKFDFMKKQQRGEIPSDAEFVSEELGWIITKNKIDLEILNIGKEIDQYEELNNNLSSNVFDDIKMSSNKSKLEVLNDIITTRFKKIRKRMESLLIESKTNVIVKNCVINININMKKNVTRFNKIKNEYLKNKQKYQEETQPEQYDGDDDDDDNNQIKEQKDNKVLAYRNKEIMKIAKEMTELTEMFNEVNVMIIESGTLLDNIEHNIDITHNDIQIGTKDIVQAEKSSRGGYAKKCILFLFLFIFVLIVIIIVKFGGKN